MHALLLLFYSLLFLAVIVLLILFLRSNYRTWKKSPDFGKSIEQPKYDYMKKELEQESKERRE